MFIDRYMFQNTSKLFEFIRKLCYTVIYTVAIELVDGSFTVIDSVV